MVAYVLAKAGFYGGSVDNVFNSRVDYVLKTYHYEMFCNDYETTMHFLNNKERK